MKRFLICLVIPFSLFSSEVREFEFKYLIRQQIREIDEAILNLTVMDSSDAYTFYYLLGIKEGLCKAITIFDDCIIERSGCDYEKYNISLSGK